MKRISKEEANYKEQTTDDLHCSNCSMFEEPSGCTLVKGEIRPGGWCKYYERKKNATRIRKANVMSDFQFFMPIAKVDAQTDGTCIVSGYASTPAKDSDGEIITLKAVKEALPAYMRWRNIREMHQLKAVGKAAEANIDGKGLWLSAKIVDPAAVQKCVTEVYQGFSIGGRKLAKDGNKITKLEMTEISVVDRPANSECSFTLAKSAKDMGEASGYLLELPPRVSREAKALSKMAKIVQDLAKAGPPAAHDGLSLPAKKAENISPDDNSEQNNKANDASAPCETHGKIGCKECMTKADDKTACKAHGVVGCDKCALDKREFTDDKRQQLADSGAAMPDGSYPIENVKDLENAIQAYGRAKDKAKAKAHIVSRAKALNAEGKLPEDWGKAGAKKAKKLAKARFAAAFGLRQTPAADPFVLRKYDSSGIAGRSAPVIETNGSPLVKSMGTAGSLAYCFDSIRNAQRSLMMEGEREGGDKKDQGLAKQLGSIAKQLAEVIGQKAEHEGEEAIDLSDADDLYLQTYLGEDYSMTKVMGGNAGGSGDPIADAVAELMKRASTPTRMARMAMAKADIDKSRKAAKSARKAVKEVHKMLKTSYMAKAEKAKKKPDDNDEDDFDHAEAMGKLQKAYQEIDKSRTMAKAASGQLAKAASRSGQRGQEAGDPEAGFYEVPPGVTDLTPAAMAGAAPGTKSGGSQPPLYPDDGSVYAGKTAGGGDDLRKYIKDGQVPVAVMELLMKQNKMEGELEALRRMPASAAGGRRPMSFDMTKVYGGTNGSSADTQQINKSLFDGVDPNALSGGDKQQHTAAAAKVIGNFLTSGHFAKSILDPTFRGAAGGK